MTIDYGLVVRELRDDLENLAQQDADRRVKTCADLEDTHFDRATRAKVVASHCMYVKALDDALKATAERYHAEYKPLSPRFE